MVMKGKKVSILYHLREETIAGVTVVSSGEFDSDLT